MKTVSEPLMRLDRRSLTLATTPLMKSKRRYREGSDSSFFCGTVS